MSFCINCGTQIPDGSRFCPNCGAPVGANPQPQYQQPYQAPQQPQNQKMSYMDRVREARAKQPLSKVNWYHYAIAAVLVYLLTQFLG